MRWFFVLPGRATLVGLLAALSLSVGCSDKDGQAQASDSGSADADDTQLAPATLRVAAFNASLFRQSDDELRGDLDGGDDPQAKQVAQLLQHVRPDVVLINEFDWDAEGESARIFEQAYLSVSQGGGEPLEYAFHYVPETNTGVHSGVDLNNDGQAVSTPGSQAYGEDAYGFGTFPGQYGMVIYSRYPIVQEQARTVGRLLWKDMPDNLLPDDWYSAEAVDVLRLSSKNHVDVPIEVDGHIVHMLASHPTPPSFDGPEDRNGRRNHDEIRFWVDYITGGDSAAYIQDDAGVAGGLEPDAAFVLLGDLNSDPHDGDSRREALHSLLEHARVQDPQPQSDGAEQAAESDGGANTSHQGDPRLDTADFNDGRVGNLRVDYALPSSNLRVNASAVFWPAPGSQHAELASVSDHHLVWVDVTVGP